MSAPGGDPRPGLLVMSYGTPASADEIEPYYTHIRRGRPPTAEQLADLRMRYNAIGGLSPMAARTREQADAITAGLERAEPGVWTVALGGKHAAPFVEDAAGELARAGVSSVTGLVLAPHFSQASVGGYHDRARAALVGTGLPYRAIDQWHDEAAWRDFQARQVRAGLAELEAQAGGQGTPVKVLFTAHSLPERVLVDDPYVEQLETSATAIADRAGLDPQQWALAWQSAGRTPEPWRGPDIADALRSLAAEGDGRVRGVLVCAQGFVSDHLEILYDLDIDATRVATEVGLTLARTASLNDDAAVMTALAGRVRQVGGR